MRMLVERRLYEGTEVKTSPMRQPIRWLISLIAVAMFIGACGGSSDNGGGSDANVQVQRYIDTVNPMFKEANDAGDANDKETPPPGAESEAGDAKRWFDRSIGIQEKLVGALGGVGDPPVELKEAHNNYVAAMSESLVLDRKIRDRLAEAGSDFDMAQLANDPELGTTPQGRLGDLSEGACKELERVANQSNVNVDLSCLRMR